jgi:hypothetical protein
MPLAEGRRQAHLTPAEIVRAMDTFTGLDADMRNVRHMQGARTVFRVVPAAESETGEPTGEIVFGPNIYPGQGLTNPNSVLSMRAAAAHELAHYHRWHDATQRNEAELEDLDEAMTSLEAIQRYGRFLSSVEVEQLVGDALYRMGSYLANQVEGEPFERCSAHLWGPALLATFWQRTMRARS